MLVFTEDIRRLVEDVTVKYESQYSIEFGSPTIQEYFSKLVNSLNKELNTKLNSDTVYKHYHIRLKTHTSSEIGYSINYLNALSNYVHGKDYLDKYPRIVEDDNEIPEFPSYHPCFPATPAIKIYHSRYTDLWIKNENHNPCGIHKDRKAHEIYLLYNRIIKEQLLNDERLQLPRLSIISAGYAALSIQYKLRQTGLPDLKVLVDNKIDKELYKMLKNSRAEVYKTNLRAKKLSSENILKLTNNIGGVELTYGDEVMDITYTYYDWLSYECLNLNPNMLIAPYGSGELFRNMLEIHVKELKSRRNSRRYFGNRDILRDCHFIGARAEEENSKMHALVSFYDAQNPDEINNILNSKYCGKDSGIYAVKENEKMITEAVNIAEKNNIRTCASGIAGLTLLLQLENEDNEDIEVDKNSKIVIINTGEIRKDIFESPL